MGIHAHGIALGRDLQPQLFTRRRRPLEIFAWRRGDALGVLSSAAGERCEILSRSDVEADGGELAGHEANARQGSPRAAVTPAMLARSGAEPRSRILRCGQPLTTGNFVLQSIVRRIEKGRKGTVSRSWKQISLAAVAVAVGLVLTAILGLWQYMKATATPLHPSAQEVRSVTQFTPVRRWTDAVEQGRQLVRGEITEQNLPGLSVAVGVGGDVVWAEGFGLADLEKRTPVTPDTQFRIGTASISLTSAAVGLLLEKGRLNLDDEIQTYVPAFPKKQWPVTLRQLMGHLAGVRTDSGDEGPLFEQHCERPVEALPALRSSRCCSSPARVSLFELWMDPDERGRRSRRRGTVPGVHAQADLRSARHGRYDGRLRGRPDPGSRDALLSEICSRSALRPGPDAPDRLFLLFGGKRLRVHPVRPRAFRHGARAAASCCNRRQSSCSRLHSGWPLDRRRDTVLAGTSRPPRSWEKIRTSPATTETLWAGWSRPS